MVVTPVTEGSHRHQIPVSLHNSSSRPLKVRKGDIIASISPASILLTIHNENEYNDFILQELSRKEQVNSISTTRSWKPSERIKFPNNNLNKDQKLKLCKLIDEYHMIFAQSDTDIGCIPESYGQHDIQLTNSTPIKQRPYNTPQAKEVQVEEALSKMLKMNVIQESDSNWASPIVLVKKPDGSERFCVDSRKLNAVTIKDSFPMPTVESRLNKLHDSKFFTTLDCITGYWQIRLSERAKNLVAFTTNKGLYTFNFMPFGLCNASATFQRVIEKVIQHLLNTLAYVDDLLTFSKTFEDHLEHLKLLFERLKSANIKIKTSKCIFATNSTKFLGYQITSEGISIDTSRIKALNNYPKPTKSKHVKQFLGLTGYYRQLIKNYSDITEPLNQLTRQHVKFPDKFLAFPDFISPFFLSTDASQVGIGAVLSQRDKNNIEHPIYYASHSLTDTERRYSTIERELLAIINSTEKFKYYLAGRKFTIITDHNPLVYLNNIKLSSDRLTRWRFKLAEFDFDIIYKKGKANGNADAMSRIPLTSPIENVSEELHTLFSIAPNLNLIHKAQFLESLTSIINTESTITYSDDPISNSQDDEAIVICVPSKINTVSGVARSICEQYGIIPGQTRHNLELGDSNKEPVQFFV
jgi:hypothetical protein